MVLLTVPLVRSKARVDKLAEVQNLNLWGQDLTDVSVLAQLPCVEVLSLSVNRIPTLLDFATCGQLRELYLRKNEVADLAQVRWLMLLPALRVLWLSENPCTQHPTYRATVIRNLPLLEKLDNTEVSQQERQAARAAGVPLSPPTPSELAAALAAAAEARQAGGGSRQGSSHSSRRQSATDAPAAAAAAAAKQAGGGMPPLPPQRQPSLSVLHPTPAGSEAAPSPAVGPGPRPASHGSPDRSAAAAARGPGGSAGGGGSRNVLYAVMALLGELGEADLELVWRDAEMRLATMRGGA